MVNLKEVEGQNNQVESTICDILNSTPEKYNGPGTISKTVVNTLIPFQYI